MAMWSLQGIFLVFVDILNFLGLITCIGIVATPRNVISTYFPLNPYEREGGIPIAVRSLNFMFLRVKNGPFASSMEGNVSAIECVANSTRDSYIVVHSLPIF